MPREDLSRAGIPDSADCFAISSESTCEPAGSRYEGSAGRCHLSLASRQTLQRWIRAATTPQRVVRRSRIVLEANDGGDERRIAARLKTSLHTVRLWCDRVARHGIDIVWGDAPGRGRKRSITPETAERIVAAARSRHGEKTPSMRELAREFSVSAATVCRILKSIDQR